MHVIVHDKIYCAINFHTFTWLWKYSDNKNFNLVHCAVLTKMHLLQEVNNFYVKKRVGKVSEKLFEQDTNIWQLVPTILLHFEHFVLFCLSIMSAKAHIWNAT